jgi:hypothetical protein
MNLKKIVRNQQRMIAHQEGMMNSFRFDIANNIAMVEKFYHDSVHILGKLKMNPFPW